MNFNSIETKDIIFDHLATSQIANPLLFIFNDSENENDNQIHAQFAKSSKLFDDFVEDEGKNTHSKSN